MAYEFRAPRVSLERQTIIETIDRACEKSWDEALEAGAQHLEVDLLNIGTGLAKSTRACYWFVRKVHSYLERGEEPPLGIVIAVPTANLQQEWLNNLTAEIAGITDCKVRVKAYYSLGADHPKKGGDPEKAGQPRCIHPALISCRVAGQSVWTTLCNGGQAEGDYSPEANKFRCPFRGGCVDYCDRKRYKEEPKPKKKKALPESVFGDDPEEANPAEIEVATGVAEPVVPREPFPHFLIVTQDFIDERSFSTDSRRHDAAPIPENRIVIRDESDVSRMAKGGGGDESQPGGGWDNWIPGQSLDVLVPTLTLALNVVFDESHTAKKKIEEDLRKLSGKAPRKGKPRAQFTGDDNGVRLSQAIHHPKLAACVNDKDVMAEIRIAIRCIHQELNNRDPVSHHIDHASVATRAIIPEPEPQPNTRTFRIFDHLRHIQGRVLQGYLKVLLYARAYFDTEEYFKEDDKHEIQECYPLAINNIVRAAVREAPPLFKILLFRNSETAKLELRFALSEPKRLSTRWHTITKIASQELYDKIEADYKAEINQFKEDNEAVFRQDTTNIILHRTAPYREAIDKAGSNEERWKATLIHDRMYKEISKEVAAARKEEWKPIKAELDKQKAEIDRKYSRPLKRLEATFLVKILVLSATPGTYEELSSALRVKVRFPTHHGRNDYCWFVGQGRELHRPAIYRFQANQPDISKDNIVIHIADSVQTKVGHPAVGFMPDGKRTPNLTSRTYIKDNVDRLARVARFAVAEVAELYGLPNQAVAITTKGTVDAFKEALGSLATDVHSSSNLIGVNGIHHNKIAVMFGHEQLSGIAVVDAFEMLHGVSLIDELPKGLPYEMYVAFYMAAEGVTQEEWKAKDLDGVHEYLNRYVPVLKKLGSLAKLLGEEQSNQRNESRMRVTIPTVTLDENGKEVKDGKHVTLLFSNQPRDHLRHALFAKLSDLEAFSFTRLNGYHVDVGKWNYIFDPKEFASEQAAKDRASVFPERFTREDIKPHWQTIKFRIAKTQDQFAELTYNPFRYPEVKGWIRERAAQVGYEVMFADELEDADNEYLELRENVLGWLGTAPDRFTMVEIVRALGLPENQATSRRVRSLCEAEGWEERGKPRSFRRKGADN